MVNRSTTSQAVPHLICRVSRLLSAYLHPLLVLQTDLTSLTLAATPTLSFRPSISAALSGNSLSNIQTHPFPTYLSRRPPSPFPRRRRHHNPLRAPNQSERAPFKTPTLQAHVALHFQAYPFHPPRQPCCQRCVHCTSTLAETQLIRVR